MFSFRKIFSNSNSDNYTIPNITNESDIIHLYKQLMKMKGNRPNINVTQILRKCFKVNPKILDKIINDYINKK